MTFDTSVYERHYGAKPDRKEEGAWLFEIAATDGRGSYLTELFQGWGTLAGAKADAVRDMKSVGRVTEIVSVVLLP